MSESVHAIRRNKKERKGRKDEEDEVRKAHATTYLRCKRKKGKGAWKKRKASLLCDGESSFKSDRDERKNEGGWVCGNKIKLK